ncbi:MAG: hypothetical protein R6V39_06775, partial [Desulfovibrionales bacterium]
MEMPVIRRSAFVPPSTWRFPTDKSHKKNAVQIKSFLSSLNIHHLSPPLQRIFHCRRVPSRIPPCHIGFGMPEYIADKFKILALVKQLAAQRVAESILQFNVYPGGLARRFP